MLEDAVLAATDEAVTASLSSPPAYAVGSSGSGKSGAAAADDEDGSSDAALAALLGQQASIGTSNGSSSSSSCSSNGAGCSPERSGGDKAAAASVQKYKDEEEKEPHLPASVASGSFSLGAEPKAGEAGTTRLQLRLASGKTVVRRFLLEDTVATLFAVVVDLVSCVAHRFMVLFSLCSIGVLIAIRFNLAILELFVSSRRDQCAMLSSSVCFDYFVDP
jgi:hypothetical protein